MKTFDPKDYCIQIRRVHVDDEVLFSATVAELPDVEAFGDTSVEAYDLAIDAVQSLHRQASQSGREFPSPIAYRQEHSGRITLRIPSLLHRTLAEQADRNNTSLNTYIAVLLANAQAPLEATAKVDSWGPILSGGSTFAGVKYMSYGLVIAGEVGSAKHVFMVNQAKHVGKFDYAEIGGYEEPEISSITRDFVVTPSGKRSVETRSRVSKGN